MIHANGVPIAKTTCETPMAILDAVRTAFKSSDLEEIPPSRLMLLQGLSLGVAKLPRRGCRFCEGESSFAGTWLYSPHQADEGAERSDVPGDLRGGPGGARRWRSRRFPREVQGPGPSGLA